ncbi:NADP-dependent oxidoreductase, partial [Parvibaculum sp.]|uniref:NADP-dependent oxidoreductase n=1 Tax=Parvibaculum sp. TaxID=2024848 RepID=UPI002BA87751
VEISNNEKFKPGDRVTGGFGWASHALSNGRGIQKLDPALYHGKLRPTAAIGVLGIPGLTSYFGLLDLGQPKEGDTVLISSAAGPVGATAGQIAKMKGCTVVGIAGSKTKCDYVRSLGFDRAIDYREVADLRGAIAETCPGGIDIYFDNVGAEMLDAAILNMKEHGRIVVSGQVSEYNRAEGELHGIRNVTRFITHRLRMEGLVVFDYFKDFRAAQTEMAGWIHDGKLVYTEDISEGLENSAAAFIGLFEGENLGRRLIRVS